MNIAISIPARGGAAAAVMPVSEGQSQQRIEDLLVRGKTREALDTAKAGLKHHPGLAAEVLVVRCYGARAAEFCRLGQDREAAQILDYAASRFPQHARLIPSLKSLKNAGGAMPVAAAQPGRASSPAGEQEEAADRRAPVHVPPSAALPNSPAAVERLVEQRIAQGRMRDALEAAKAWLKSSPGEAAELLVVRCYQARAKELHLRGQNAEAQQIVAHATARFPQHAHLIGFKFFACDAAQPPPPTASEGELEALLAEAGKADVTAERRRELSTEVARHLTDPRDLMESAALPQGDVWKTEAGAVWSAFEAVTSRPVSPQELAGLDCISRRSPLAAWKLLVRAIQAYHQGRPEAVESNLSAIPGDSPSPVRALAPLLRSLAGLATGARRAAEQELALREISGGMWGMKPALQSAENAFAKGKVNIGFGAVASRLRLLRQHRPDLARELQIGLARCALRHEDTELEDVLQEQATQLHGAGTQADRAALAHVTALTTEGSLPAKAYEMWERFLEHKAALPSHSHGERLAPSELRLIHGRMAGLLPENHEGGPEEMLAELLGGGGRGISNLFGKMKEKQLRKALEAEATPEGYQDLYACLARRDERAAGKLAEQWGTAYPRELAPVLILMRAAEKRNALQKALSYLERAEQLNALHAEVREARFRLEYVQARKHILAGQIKLAHRDAERLEACAAGSQLAVVHALRFVLAYKTQDSRLKCQDFLPALRTSHKSALYGLLAALSIAADCRAVSPHNNDSLRPLLDLLDMPGLGGEAGLEAVLDALDLARKLSLRSIATYQIQQQCEAYVVEAPLVPDTLLARLCRTVIPEVWTRLLYLASGRGLQRVGAFAHLFLYYRGLALDQSSGDTGARVEQCYRAALKSARRCGDAEIAGKAAEALEDFEFGGRLDSFGPKDDDDEDEEISDAQVASIIKKEGAPPPRNSHRELRLPVLNDFGNGPRERKSRQRG